MCIQSVEDEGIDFTLGSDGFISFPYCLSLVFVALLNAALSRSRREPVYGFLHSLSFCFIYFIVRVWRR